jgi:hypothetical protein
MTPRPPATSPAGLRRRATRCLALVALALAPGFAAAVVEPGAPLPAVHLDDQHGQPLGVPADTRLVLFAADKAGSDLVAAALGSEAPGLLASRQAVYLADISAMPALVTRLFALPALRALPFRVGLARDAASLAELPRERGAVTLLRLSDGRLDGVDYLRDTARIRAALGLP